jgi:hypothetical protein
MSGDTKPAPDEIEIAFDWRSYPRRLNLGCGWDRRDGYLNVDLHAFHEPDLIADVRDCHQLPTGEYDELIAQDVLEHLPRADAMLALREWARLLRIGGTLVLRVPDLIGLLRLFEARSDVDSHAELVQCLFGTQAYNGDWHSNGFTELLLRHALHDTGFDVTSIAHRDEWLFDVVATRTDEPQPVRDSDLVFGRVPTSTVVAEDEVDVDVAAAIARVEQIRIDPARVGTTSRVPGGSFVHRMVRRLLARHQNAVAGQTNEALDAVTEALRRLSGLPRRGD